MPVVSIPVDRLNAMIRKPVARDELLLHVERLGCDVEGFATVTRFRCQRCGGVTEITEREAFPTACEWCGADFTKGDGTAENIGQSEVLRMELLPVRPDMFDVAGLARTLRGYLELEVGPPAYDLSPSGFRVTVDERLSRKQSYRPHIVCAVIRNLSMDEELLKIIMKMQENLHWALGRDRVKASIGVYDLDLVVPDFRYMALANDEIAFVPLGGMPGEQASRAASPRDILESHPKGTAYQHLLSGFDRYPILLDSQETVLSMPPIINSEQTRVSEKSRNLFIDVTGPETKGVRQALNVMATSLAEFGGSVETVIIERPDGHLTTPDLSPQVMELDPQDCPRLIGIDLDASQVEELLGRMRHDVQRHDGRLQVFIPAYRTDIMHPVDLVEDVAIAYGYHNIPGSLVPTLTVGHSQKLEDTSSIIRQAMTGLGFLEIITFMLTNPEDHYTRLKMDEPDNDVAIENPATVEQTIVRTHLLSGLLETFRLNRSQPTPQRIFELGDVCFIDPEAKTGATDIRKIAAAVMDPRTGFAEIKSVFEALAHELVPSYSLKATSHPLCIPGRCAQIMADGQPVGFLGEVHPEVLEQYSLAQPVSVFETTVWTESGERRL